MKLLTVIYESAIDRSLMELLEQLEVNGWTKMEGFHGKGQSGLKMGTPVWPGSINQICLAGDEESLRWIAANIRDMQEDYKLRPGIFIYLQEIEEL